MVYIKHCPQVRAGQLDKEARELREENGAMAREAEALRGAAANGAKASAACSSAAPAHVIIRHGWLQRMRARGLVWRQSLPSRLCGVTAGL